MPEEPGVDLRDVVDLFLCPALFEGEQDVPMEYRLVVEGTFLDEFHVFQVRDAKRVFGGYAYTDKDGNFTVPGLAPGWKYRMSCCPGILVNGNIQPFVTLATFTTAQTGVTELGKLQTAAR